MEISVVLSQVESGVIQLPKFQRGYEWKKPRIARFFESLYKDYPVGNLLIWKTSPERVGLRTKGSVSPVSSVDVLLDGQQRVTTLFAIVKGRPPQFFEDTDTDFPGANIHFHLGSEDFWFPTPRACAVDPLWVDLSYLFSKGLEAETEVIDNIRGSLNHKEEDLREYDIRIRKLSAVLKRSLTIDYIDGDNKDLEEIVDIFNAVNSGGQKLSKGDLALAKMAIQWPECRETLREQVKEWRGRGLDFNLDWLLLALNVVMTGNAEFDRIHEYSVKELREGYERTLSALSEALNLISDRLGLDHGKVLFGPRSLYVMAKIIDQHVHQLSLIEQERLLFWYINAALRRTKSAPRPQLQADLRDIEDPSRAINNLLVSLDNSHDSLEVKPTQLVAKERSQYYPLLYLLTRLNGARDWTRGILLKEGLLGTDSKLHVHHVFPKRRLEKAGYKMQDRNQLANLSFQTQQSNLGFGSKLPEEYFPEIADRQPGALESQWIPMDRDLWQIKNYEQFLDARRRLIADSANKHLQTLRQVGVA